MSSSGQILIEVDSGASVTFAVVYPAQGDLPGVFNLLFNYDGPQADTSETSYIAGVPSPDDPVLMATRFRPESRAMVPRTPAKTRSPTG